MYKEALARGSQDVPFKARGPISPGNQSPAIGNFAGKIPLQKVRVGPSSETDNITGQQGAQDQWVEFPVSF